MWRLRGDMALGKIFQPISIRGSATSPNRIVRAAHGTGMASPHIPICSSISYARRAAAGFALSIIEASLVHPSTALDFQLYGDQLVPGYKRLMAAIRPYDMRVFQQLWHGGNTYYALDGKAHPGPFLTCRALLESLVEQWATLNSRVGQCVASSCPLWRRRAGSTAWKSMARMAISFTSSSLAFYNTRDDEYGGPRESRAPSCSRCYARFASVSGRALP